MQNYTILAVIVSSFLFVGTVFGAYEISDGSVKALYHLEDGVDSSGGGYNCTLSNGASAVAGKLANAIDFESGSSQFCEDGDLVDMTNLGMSFWVKPESQK